MNDFRAPSESKAIQYSPAFRPTDALYINS